MGEPNAATIQPQGMSLTSNPPLPQNRTNYNDVPEQQHQPKYNLPCGDLLDGRRRRKYMDICIPLYKAAIIGDLDAARRILDDWKDLVRYGITEYKDTVLHVAAMSQSSKFVKYLVDMMTPSDLELQNAEGDTALCLAAITGNVETAKIMISNNQNLPTIAGRFHWRPIYLAASYGKRDMASYLYDVSRRMRSDDWKDDQEMRSVFKHCVASEYLDLALRILEDKIGLLRDEDVSEALLILAEKPIAFREIEPHVIWRIISSIICVKVGPAIKESDAKQLLRKVWEIIMLKSNDDIYDILKGPPETPVATPNDVKTSYPSQVLSTAAKMGNTKFLIELIHVHPDLLWKTDDDKRTIFHIAVYHRHASIYNLLYEMGPLKETLTPLFDIHGNNMLHFVGMKAKTDPANAVLGAAFQLQRELLWFQEVKNMIPPPYREAKNAFGRTPHELFIENHNDMVLRGEKWMKGTANQCLVVAALITTVVFSVAFTIPGGYDQNTGFPIFLHNRQFLAFVILDAISLILSSASILMFLSILTSRYAERDFLKSLPLKLIIGLATLFLSIVTMMVSFAISFFVIYRNNLIVIPIIISVVAAVPILLYAKLQFPLLLDACRSTYATTYLFKPKKRMLYYKNPMF